MAVEKMLAHTRALCPYCKKVLPATRFRRGDTVYLKRVCPEHGEIIVPIWQGLPDYEAWGGEAAYRGADDIDQCPTQCGLCRQHRRSTCCLLLEVTQRCNLNCPVCYAGGANTGEEDPTLEDLSLWLDVIVEKSGYCNIQLSGGEPTVRDDLPQIIAMIKARGFSYVQLNTNGLRLAAESGYIERLKKAGLDCVFLQFDSMEDSAYTVLRGRALLQQKKKAVQASTDAGMGVVLVVTLVDKINDTQLGDIMAYAVENMPGVRGVHIQPISYFGRFPDFGQRRLTIPQVLSLIEEQTGGGMRADDFKPGVAENPYCSFNGAYLLEPDGILKPLNPRQGCCCEQEPDVTVPQQYVAKQWGYDSVCCDGQLREKVPESMEEFLERTAQYTLAVSGMVFQDAHTADLIRLQECYIHVMKDERAILPFCACNLLHR